MRRLTAFASAIPVLGLVLAYSGPVSAQRRSLPLRSGTELTLLFDQATRRAEFFFTVAERAFVRVQLLFPNAWLEPAELCGIEGLEFTDDPGKSCAEFVDIEVEGSSGTHEPDFFKSGLRASPTSDALFTLEAGRYVLRLTIRQNRWPQTSLPARLVTQRPRLRVLEVAPTPMPESLVGLDKWFEATGLSGAFQLIHVYSPNREPDRFIGAEQAEYYDSLLAGVGRTLAMSATPRAAPSVVIRMRAKTSRDTLREIEGTFKDQTAVPFWLRVFQKINLQGFYRSHEVLIYMPVICSASLIYETEPGVVSRVGPECVMATAAVNLPPAMLEGLVVPGDTWAAAAPVDLADELSGFLPEYFSPAIPDVEYLGKSGSYVEVVVRGLRGQVIKGGREWEKVQIMFMLTGGTADDPTALRVAVDGQLASGMGAYPVDTQFTKSMEPEYYQSLSEYAKALVEALKDYITGGGLE